MLKINYKKVSLLLMLILILNSIAIVHAQDHRLDYLDIEVNLHEDGSATITERRASHLVEGTENYIVIENLGESEIHSFTVIEDGISYDYVENWNIDASREEKAFKNGIIETSSGYELAWGIGEYGYHNYTLEYRVTNFVKQLEDSQAILWKFVNQGTNIPPQSVTVTIDSMEHYFSEENEGIWAFGFSGDINFQDGSILAISDSPLSSRNYVTILTRFEDGMFATDDVIDENFDTIQNMAFEGSDYSQEGSNNIFSFFGAVIRAIFPLLFVVGAFLFRSNKSSNRARKFKRKYKEEYYRDIPYRGNLIDAYYILFKMGASNFERLLTAFILRWVKEGRINIEKEEKGLIRKREITNLKFTEKKLTSDENLEGQLFNMILSASGSNEILEESEFTKWARSNHSKLTRWEENVKTNSSHKLQEEGYLNVIEKEKLFIFKDHTIEKTPKGEELEERIYKYINYLHDFSLLNEHEAINVTIWDEIMIWAAVLGLTKQVMDEFIKLYPAYAEESVYTGHNTIFLVSNLTRNVSAARVQSTGNSGGGGRASFGGGGGSFGGGRGGGTR